MKKYLYFTVCGLLSLAAAGQAQATCPAGTLWEPFAGVCADVNDIRDQFVTALQKSTAVHSSAPVPGSMSAGTAYAPGQLTSMQSSRLHTRMFVYPGGLERDAELPAWLYTTATSRVDNGLELLAMYSESQAEGYLGLFAWSCLPDYPCPDGATVPAWQWSRSLPQFACNITHVVDQGGHAQKQLYYANHSDRMDNGSPPLWKSAIYLWNYCDDAWDLAWEHQYRADKQDCSLPGATCAWWGPSVEIFGDAMYPQIGELGYEDSLLYHDGTWSLLAPPETEFRDPTNPVWGSQTPWQTFHLEPNRSYGVGSWFNDNDAPVIEDQVPLNIDEGEPLPLDTSLLTINDADVDPAYHVAYGLNVYGGNNYTYADGVLTPDAGFTGTLVVPISVSDGAAHSATFDLIVTVGQADDPPVIHGQLPLQMPEDQSIVINIDDLVVDYPGHDPATLSVIVHEGQFYSYNGTTVTPSPDFYGDLNVSVTVTDGVLESAVFPLTITVTPVNDPPSVDGQFPVETLERTPVEITTAHLVLSDPDNDAAELSVRVLDGAGYQRVGNTITPDAGIVGQLIVHVVANDGELDSAVFDVTVQVIADTVPPQIVLLGSATVTIDQGDTYTDAGATATDNIDGDISDQIVVDNPVDTDQPGTYTVTYTVEDLAGNTTVATRTVIVEATVNDPPVIQGQLPLQTPEDKSIVISIDDLVVDYPDHDPATLSVIVHEGQFYSYSGTTVTPSPDFYGDLTVSVTVTDGVLESAAFPLTITVTPVNDPPSVDGQFPVETLERTPVEITAAHLELSDPDNDAVELSVRVLDGAGYQRVDNTITPEPGVVGQLGVRLVANDGSLDSAVFVLDVQVLADTVPPVIVVTGSPTVTINLGGTYTDAGATATDNIDGDICDQIVVDNPVDTSQVGTYTITYTVDDFAGNSTVATRTVIVQAPSGGDAPVIRGQVPLQTQEDQSIVIDIDDLIVDYPDNNPANLDVIIHDGEFYTYSGTTVAPSADFYGDLAVPITVTDGVLESAVFPLTITVTPVNDPPSVNGQFPVETLERTPVEITTAHLVLSDPDNNAAELSVRVLDGAGYQRVDNTITPEPGVVGAMIVRLVVNDGELNSAVFNLTVQVRADNVPPVIVVNGSPTVTINLGGTYTDAGATATDNVDGDISDQIVVDNPVDTSQAATYTITYSVEDLSGNTTTAIRTVIVQASAPPPPPVVNSGGGGGAISGLLVAFLVIVWRRHPGNNS
ncbi:MAG: DUF5011 domain-containing protein [Gammaproteobacteria bacterium]|nr:DUF5011 domain-containing protein [Gammaproteobacteria bacterium]